MKKFLFGLLSISLFIFTACNNLINNNSDNFSFGLDQSVARSIQNSVLSSGVISNFDQVTLSCSITNYRNKTESKSVSLDKLDKAKLSFNAIPYGRKLNFSVAVSYKGIPLYEGIQNNIVLTYSKNNFSISLNPARYDITYNTNGGTLPSSNKVTSYNFSSEIKTLPLPEKEGYYFVGWYEDPSCLGTPISSISSSDYGNKTYYAKWRLAANLVMRNITYVSNGEVVRTLQVPNGTVLSNTELAPLNDTDTHSFDSWTLNNSRVEPNTYTITSDITLNAQWYLKTSLIQYTVTYVDPLGTNSERKVFPYTNLTQEYLPELTKEGYYFKGWCLNGNKVELNPITSVTSDITLEARWDLITDLAMYTVSYVSNGKTIKTKEVPFGTKLSSTDLAPLTNTDTEAFIGWYIGDKKIENNTLQVTKDITLTAKWNTIQYTITYEDSLGTTTKTTVAPYTILTKNHLKDLSKEGYTFKGWFLNNKKVEYDSYTVTGDITLKAEWKKLHNVYYYSSKGTVFDDVVPIEEGTILSNQYLPILENVVGYEFSSWTIDNQPVTANNVTVNKDITLTAQWTPITYNITYNQKDENNTVKKVTYTIEDLPYSLENITRQNYGFGGWYLNNETTGKAVTQITADDILEDKVYYAKWTQNTYSVKYRNEHSVVPLNKTVNGGAKLTVNDLPNMSAKGYKFDGWYISDTKINEGYEVTSDIELVAKWSIVTYTITYDLNYPDSQSQTATYTVKNIPYELLNPSRTNYGFEGWFSTADCKGTSISNITIDNIGDKTLYAKWSQNQSFITYKSIHGQVPSKKAIGTGSTLTIVELPNLSEDGYIFNGWYLDTVLVNENSKYVINNDITLTAKWTPITYSITYNLDQGKWGTDKGITEYTTESPNITIPSPIRKGYKFMGWDLDSSGNVVMSPTITTGSVGKRAYTAHWKLINYKIEYNNCEGAINDNPSTYNVETPSFTLKNPSKDNFNFVGWYTDNTYKTKADIDIKQGITVGKKTYWANWSKNLTVSYSSSIGTAPNSFEVTSGTKLTASNLPKLTEEGYTFNGWYVGNKKIVEGEPITKDITLTAKWTKNSYAITYVSEQGGAPGITSLEHGTILTIEHLPNATKEGYKFLGWYINNVKVDASSNYKVTKPITIEGRWDYIYYPINYYYVEDGKNENRTTYTVVSETFTLSNPTRNGYDFVDWYSDESLKNPAKKTITKGSTGERSFYAKWVKKESRTFLWDTNGNAYLTNDVTNPGTPLFSNKNIKDFCFDSDGGVHIVGTDGYHTSNPKSSIPSISNRSLITYDFVSKKIYMASQNNNGTITGILEKGQQTDLSNFKASSKKNENFAVYDGTIYIVSYSSQVIIVNKYTIDKKGIVSTPTSREIDVSSGLTNLSSGAVIKISDVYIYRNYIYLTLMDVSGMTLRSNSRGALIRIPLELNSYEILGWTSKKNPNVQVINPYAPTTKDSNTGLFGPCHIIKISANSIQIADEGVFITVSAPTQGYYENIDRVVTIDTSTFKITDVKVLNTLDKVNNIPQYGYFDEHTTKNSNLQGIPINPKSVK